MVSLLTKEEILHGLRALSAQMADLGMKMEYSGGFSPIAQKGIELQGAAGIARSWIAMFEDDATKQPIKIMVLGYAKHGKDTACEFLRDTYGLKFKSSSEIACELFIYNVLKPVYGYSTIEECFNDRVNHRETWHQLIKAYQGDNKTMLTRAIFKNNHIYCGNRAADEVQAARQQGMVDCVIWIDASKRKPTEPLSSCTVTADLADYVIDNNGTLEDLWKNLTDLFDNEIWRTA